jgi:hypothetical protein
MELKARALQESDWETLVKWWLAWKDWGVNPSKDMLSQNGTGGLLIEKNGVPIMAGFLYFTNSKVAWMEWIVSDPEYKEKDRVEALKLLINSLENIAKESGMKIILSIGRNKSLMAMHEKLGYTVDKEPSYEISKIIG